MSSHRNTDRNAAGSAPGARVAVAVALAEPPRGWLRWFANLGLSLSAADCALPYAEKPLRCPFARVVSPPPRSGHA